MSREIDLENLSDTDKIYIAQRPGLRAEIILQGFDDPLEGFDLSVLNPNETPAPPVQASVDEDPSEDESEGDWSPRMPKAELQAVIDARNEGRDDDDLIVVDGDKKDDLIAALSADDEASA